MDGTPWIVSMWRDEQPTAFLCSGVLLDDRYLLSVAHAFDNLAVGDRAFVGLLPGKHGTVPARLLDRHGRLDAALFQLAEQVAVPALRLPDDVGSYMGADVVLHVVNPDTLDAAPIVGVYSISDYSSDGDCEYVLHPQTALGNSGGVVTIDGEAMALLNRRNVDDPMARAIALCELRRWIACALDSRTAGGGRPPGGTQAAFETWMRLLGRRAMDILADQGTADLRRIGGFARDARVYTRKERLECFQPLMADLYRATGKCLPAWTQAVDLVRKQYRDACLMLMGELIKLGVDRQRDPAELAEIDAATPDRMFVACKRTGTAAAVYCSLSDVPLRLNDRLREVDVQGGSVVDLGDLATGVGPDAQRDALAAVWLNVKGEAPPEGIDEVDLVETLADAIAMDHEEYGRDPPFLVAQGPREWLQGDGFAGAAEALRIGLVIHKADSDYAYLAVTERRLINHICKYLKLLEAL